MRTNIKKTLLSLGSITAIAAPVAIAVSCGSTNAQVKADNKALVNHVPLKVKDLQIIEGPMKVNTWHADNDNSIDDAMVQMDSFMHIFLPKKLVDMTPFEFAKWLVDIYNNNGSGVMDMTVEYKGQLDVVHVNFKQPLLEILKTLADAQVDESTPRGIIHTSADRSALVQRMGGLIELGKAVGGLANPNGYAGDLFDTDFMSLMGFGPSHTSMMNGGNPVAEAMFSLIMPLPDTTLKAFTKVIQVFKDMAQGFIHSAPAHQWAVDKKQLDKFEKIDHYMIRSIMHRAS